MAGFIQRLYPASGVDAAKIQGDAVSIKDPSAGQGLVWDEYTKQWIPAPVAASAAWGAITGTLSNQTDLAAELAGKATKAQGDNADAFRVDVDAYGFLNQAETSLSFNDTGGTGGNGLFTLTSVGASWSYYKAGVKHTITGSKSIDVPAATATTTIYFITIDGTDGSLSCSTTAWNLDTDGKVPVATVTRNSGLYPKYLVGEERHTVRILRRDHFIEHNTSGALYVSGGVVSGQTINSSTNTNKTCAVTAIRFLDEDIDESTLAIPDGDGSTNLYYSILYRTGATAWSWERSLMPFKYSGAGAIQYDNSGTMTAATSGSGVNQRWVNYWLMATNVAGQESVVFIAGRTQHTSLTLANAETFPSLTGCPIQDGVAIWRFTWHTNGANAGLCQLAQTPVRVNTNIVSGSGTLATSASAVTVVPAGNISSTDVQSALEELDTEKASVREIKTSSFTAAINGRYTTSHASVKVVVTDPTGTTAGQIYSVLVGLGTMDFGSGTVYVASRMEIVRYFDGANWSTLTPTLSDNLTLNGTANTAPNQTAASGSSLMTRDLSDARYGVLAMLSADSATRNSGTRGDISGLSIALTAGTYRVDAQLALELSTVADGSTCQMAYSGSTTSSKGVVTYYSAAATTANAGSPSIISSSAALQTQVISYPGRALTTLWSGVIVVSNGGNLTLQMSTQSSTPSGTVKALAGSYIFVSKI